MQKESLLTQWVHPDALEASAKFVDWSKLIGDQDEEEEDGSGEISSLNDDAEQAVEQVEQEEDDSSSEISSLDIDAEQAVEQEEDNGSNVSCFGEYLQLSNF